MDIVALDIEIYTPIPSGESDWDKYRPFGVSCIGLRLNRERPIFYYEESDSTQGVQMSIRSLDEVIEVIENLYEKGAKFITWNGLNFDFSVLSEETGQRKLCTKIALNHYDLMFHCINVLGFPIGLDAAARGYGLGGKYKGLDGGQVPLLWQQGKKEEVLTYLTYDLDLLYEIYLSMQETKEIRWITKKGEKRIKEVVPDLLTVGQWLEKPEPQLPHFWASKVNREKITSWMSK